MTMGHDEPADRNDPSNAARDAALVPRVLFVCLGNICRSPLMEGLVRARWPADAPPLLVDSAGLGAWHAGQPPDPRAIAVAARHGVDIAAQRARALVADDFRRFELILCADRTNLAELERRRPADAIAHVARFLDHAGIGGDVPDPYTGGEREFAAVHHLLARGAEALVARLRGPPPG
jgi:protein-tyrosine phosphatase